MLIDARALEPGSTLEFPLAIIGAGPCGLAAAAEFAGRGLPVCVLESGDLGFSAEAQSLAEAEIAGARFLEPHISRYRGFGGTTKRWAGFCTPLDPEDFEERPWLPYSGWPFPHAHLAPFYEAALDFAGLTARETIPHLGPLGRLRDVLGQSGTFEPYTLHRAPARQFGKSLRERFRRAADITICLNATVTEIETDAFAQRVERLHLRGPGGRSFALRAQHVILAAGGIENARLLLLSNKVEPAGLGNGHDLVGRFLMNHPYLMGAWVELGDHAQRLGTASSRFNPVSQRIVLKADRTEQEQMGRFSAYILPVDAPLANPWARGAGLEALTQLLGWNTEAGHTPDRMALLSQIMGDMPGLMQDARRKLLGRWQTHRFICAAAESEQLPNPQSRVTLSATRDALGQNRARVDWRLAAIDKYTMRRGLEILGEAARAAGLGSTHSHGWFANDGLTDYPGGDWAHHCGTTRMSTDPKQGVVDVEGRVHGLANLHATGCSVFPTCGIAPPTLTAMALSIRLARHLKKTTFAARAPHAPRQDGAKTSRLRRS